MRKFKNKYRIPSARLQTWDFSWPGMYFVTICTKNRECFFGEIINDEMYLNEIGKIADHCWSEIPNHFKNIELGEFGIMPNHTHGIIIINANAETGHALSLRTPQQQSQQTCPPHFRFRNQGKGTLSAIVGSFKSAVTRLSKSINSEFGWQSRFHDHIIRSHAEFIRISNYIINNPRNWKGEKFYRS